MLWGEFNRLDVGAPPSPEYPLVVVPTIVTMIPLELTCERKHYKTKIQVLAFHGFYNLPDNVIP